MMKDGLQVAFLEKELVGMDSHSACTLDKMGEIYI